MTPRSNSLHYRFGRFTLLPGRRELLCDGRGISLTPKEFQTLLLLVQAEGMAVERETFMRAIWPDTVVGDTSLGRNISVLRRHLGQEAIVSVARFGYRFTLQVDEVRSELPLLNAPAEADVVAATVPDSYQRRDGTRRLLWLSLALLAVALTLTWTVRHRVRVRAAKAETNAEAAYWQNYGSKALEEGTYFKAAKAFRQASTLAPNSAAMTLNLAETSFLRDFIETAQKQVLQVESAAEYQELSTVDSLRLDALRALIVQDYATANAKYQLALSQAAEPERLLLLEEAAMAYQRQGDLANAEQRYREAARLNPVNAGPELALGHLDVLERKWPEAAQHYDRADQLFQAGSNMEGVAEVDYQRALMSYVQARYVDEEAYLTRSLTVAQSIADPELALRCLGAFSVAYRWMNRLDRSQQFALQETETAMQAASIFFYADGMMAQANVALALHETDKSRSLLHQAADLAQQTGNARQQANVEYSLAQFSGDTSDYAGEIAYARQALRHYQSYGSMDGVADAQLLRIKGERGSGALTQALAEAQELLRTSEATHSDLFAEDTEEELGNIYSAMNNEPEALIHYLAALAWSRRTGSELALKTLNVARSYAKMAQWSRARAAWNGVPASAAKDPDCAAEYAQVRGLLKGS